MNALKRFLKVLLRGRLPSNREPANELTFNWRRLFKPHEQVRFFKLVQIVLNEYGTAFEIRAADLILDGGRDIVYLPNLVRLCKAAGPDHWPEVIRNYFRLEQEAAEARKAGRELFRDWASVSGLLSVSLQPETVGTNAPAIVAREDLESTRSVLVLHLPDAILNVHPDEVALWGKSQDELFEVGLQNVHTYTVPAVTEDQLEGGIPATILTGASPFLTTYAFFLKEYPSALGPYGALFCIPTRHQLACCPLLGQRASETLHTLVDVAVTQYNHGLEPLSPYVYWYHEGKYTSIPVDPASKSVRLPPIFEALLNQISQTG